MGAVQKLATVVIIGLVALATALTVYIARENDRRDTETTEQQDIAIERGTELYIKYCLQCHGPDGLGAEGPEENKRIGAVLNKEGAGIPEDPPTTFVNFQSDNPADQALAEDFIHFRIENGAPADPRLKKLMPAFGTELNVEEINDLVYMIMNADWDYVYNQAVLTTGQTVAQNECDANDGEGEYCDNIEEAPPVYPTSPPPTPTPGAEEGAATPEGGESDSGSEAVATIEAQDPYSWSVTEVTVKPGDTIKVVPSSGLQHDFSIDEFGIDDVLDPNTDPIMITIPEDAEPGDYTFYCSIPGHREQGMEGTLTVEAP